MLRHPSRHYVYFLFSRRTMDVATIIKQLRELSLPVPFEADEAGLKVFAKELLDARVKMKFPAGYNPLAPNEQTRAFFKRWKIADMWAKDEFVGRAIDVLNEPRIRRMMETMILGPLSVRDIAMRVAKRFGLRETAMNTRVVRAYMHYFWDDTVMTETEWRRFVGGNSDYMTALTAPRTPVGAALTIAAADRGGGQSLNSVAMYSAIRDQGFRMFMEHALYDRPSLNRTQAALFALNIITTAEEELDKNRGGSAELLEELYKIETVYDTQKVTTIHELPTIRKSLPGPPVIDAEAEVVAKPQEEPADDRTEPA